MSVRPLPSALQQKAIIELNEVPDRIQEDLQRIKDWLAKQPHLKPRTDDQWLLTFLRGCKFSLERTKEKLDLLYAARSLIPEFFNNRDPFLPEIQEFLKRSTVVILPKTADPAAPRVIILHPETKEPEKIPFMTGVKAALMILDIIILEDDNLMVAGQKVLINLKDLSYQHIMEMTPSNLKKSALCLQHAYPTRPKGLYFINTPPVFEVIFKVIKRIATPKVMDRIKFCTSDSVYDYIPRSILPKEYGGEEDSVEKLAAELRVKVESYRDWFREDANFYSDETKRPGKPTTTADLFGVEGSFRKLAID